MKLKVEYDQLLPEDIMILRSKEQNDFIPKINNLLGNPYLSTLIFAQQDESFIPIEVKDIHYFYTERKAVFLSKGDECFRTDERLYELNQRLPSSFVRISRFEIINLQYVKRFEYTFGGKFVLHMKNGEKLYTTKSYTKVIKNLLKGGFSHDQ